MVCYKIVCVCNLDTLLYILCVMINFIMPINLLIKIGSFAAIEYVNV